MQQSILPNHIDAGIAEHSHVLVRDVLPDFPAMRFVINADRDHLCVLSVKVSLPLRELAQLIHAEGSPISTVEKQHNSTAMLCSEVEILTGNILQSEVWRNLLCSAYD